MKIDKRTFQKILDIAGAEAMYADKGNVVCSICFRETLCTNRTTPFESTNHTKGCPIGKGIKLLGEYR